MKVKKNDNYLDLIPVRRKDLDWYCDTEGRVHIKVLRDGWLDKVVRLFVHTPKFMRIDLDEIGSAAFQAMDGSTRVGEICEALRHTFGDAVEPVYERVGTYINILRNNHFIELTNDVSIEVSTEVAIELTKKDEGE